MSLWAKALTFAFVGPVVLFLTEQAERVDPTRTEGGDGLEIGLPPLTHFLLQFGYYLGVVGTLVLLATLVGRDATPTRLGLSLLPGLTAILLVFAYWPPPTAARYRHVDDYPQRPLPFAPLNTDNLSGTP